MSTTVDERRAYLEIVSNSWSELKQLADSLTDTELEMPNTIGIWSGRDMLGHLAGWEAIGIDIVKQLNERGEFTPLGINRETVDAFNEEMLIPYRAMTTPEVRQSFEATHRDLVRLAEASTHADVAEVVLDVTRDHYNKHLDDLRRVRR